LTWLGNELGNHFDIKKYSMLPVSVPIASQCLHGTGLAYAEKYKKTKRVAISFVGDGGTSEGDFYEAINFAGVWKAPKIFFVQNNQWGISTPRAIQTASKTLAEKAFAAGFEGIQVDGNDIFAVYASVKMAAEKARNGEGPTLIEGYTYRLGAHTTADDPTRYRNEADVKPWEAKEPLVRLEKYILSKKLFSEEEIKKMKEDALQYAKDEFEAAEKHALPSIEDTFRYMYREMPDILKEQMEEIKLRIEGAK
jgi:pyruvate dehydrogenase E1 component alpha subunit